MTAPAAPANPPETTSAHHSRERGRHTGALRGAGIEAEHAQAEAPHRVREVDPRADRGDQRNHHADVEAVAEEVDVGQPRAPT